MGTVHKPKMNTFDLVIVVDDIDAIKVWSEQIECALAGLKPKYHVARSGISHLDRNRICLKATKKLLFLLDTKHRTFGSQMMSQWIEHFCRRRPKDVLCVLVDSVFNFDSCSSDMVKNGMSVVKTDVIANFHYWWPKMVEFLFLQTKAAPKVLNYSLETVHTHEDEPLPRRLTQCLDAFVDPEMTRDSTKCQTVKVVGATGEENPEARENMHVVIASLGVDRSVYDHCNSVHTRADVLRCVLFILIDSGIAPCRRLSRKELVWQNCKSLHDFSSHVVNKVRDIDPLMFLLSSLVFVMNLPAALLVLCYAFVPFFGLIISLHLGIKPKNIYFMIVADVFFLAPFVIIGLFALTDIINIHLSTTWIIVCFFILPLAYIVGWVTIVHYVVSNKIDCEYGIWSLPGYLWSTDYKLPVCCIWLYTPAFLFHCILVAVFFIVIAYSFSYLILFTCILHENSDNHIIFQINFNKHILASEAIIITIVLISLGYAPGYILPAGFVGMVYFVSGTQCELWQNFSQKFR